MGYSGQCLAQYLGARRGSPGMVDPRRVRNRTAARVVHADILKRTTWDALSSRRIRAVFYGARLIQVGESVRDSAPYLADNAEAGLQMLGHRSRFGDIEQAVSPRVRRMVLKFEPCHSTIDNIAADVWSGGSL